MARIERLALSFGLSIAVVLGIGIILNYTPWGISLYPILISITIFILAISIVAFFRQRRLVEADRLTIPPNLSLASWKGQSLLDRILSVILIVVILGTAGAFGYAMGNPTGGERFTEFYILGPEGKAEGYPQELVVGEEGKVIVGIINQEHATMSYRVELAIDGAIHNKIGPLVLPHKGRWEREVNFVPTQIGEAQKVEMLLYKQGRSEAYRSIHLWINVKEQD